MEILQAAMLTTELYTALFFEQYSQKRYPRLCFQGSKHFFLSLQSAFSERPRREEVFMFMAKLTSRAYGLLTDILKLDVDTGNAIKVGTMTNIVEKPGFFISAACCSGKC